MYGIKANYSLVYHPQVNGMAKATNKAIVGNMLRNLEDLVGRIAEGSMGPENDKEKSDERISIRFGIRNGSSTPYRSWISNSNHYGYRESRGKSALANQKYRST